MTILPPCEGKVRVDHHLSSASPWGHVLPLYVSSISTLLKDTLSCTRDSGICYDGNRNSLILKHHCLQGLFSTSEETYNVSMAIYFTHCTWELSMYHMETWLIVKLYWNATPSCFPELPGDSTSKLGCGNCYLFLWFLFCLHNTWPPIINSYSVGCKAWWWSNRSNRFMSC